MLRLTTKIARITTMSAAIVAMTILGPSTAAGAAATTLAANVPIADQLIGQTTGGTANYPFVGDGRVVTVVFRYANGNPVIDPGVGFIVFQGTDVVSNQPASGGVNGTTTYSFQTSSGAGYDLQAYNYIPGFPMNYSLLLADPFQPLPPATAGPVVTPTPAAGQPVLSRGQSIVQESAGQASGSTNDYLLVGDGQPLTLVLNYRPRDPIVDSAVGMNVYDQWANALQTRPMGTSVNPSSALVWTFTPAAATNYDIQVFNYQPNLTVTYTLTAI